MRIIILDKPVVIDGIQHREGDIVQIDDGVKLTSTKLKDTFTEDCIRKVLVGKPKEKPLVIKEIPNGEIKQN